jgi:hypothetical protein
MTITNQTRVIDLHDLAAVRESVAKANRKAVKIGLPGYVLHEGARSIRSYRDEITGFERAVPQVEVSVLGEAPKWAGWTLVAVLSWDESEVVTKAVEGLVLDAPLPRPQERLCEHCNARRDRNQTFLLRHDSGEFKQVGSTCLAEFLGVKVNLSLIGYNPFEGCDSTNRYQANREWTLGVLSIAVTAIRLWGWTSVKAAQEQGKVPTKERVADILWNSGRIGQEARAIIRRERTEADEAKAEAVLEWARSLDDASDYTANLRASVGQDTFATHNLGLVVSAVGSYDRAQEREVRKAVERQQQAASEHRGEVGDKVEVVGTLSSIRYIEGAYGTTTLYVIQAGSDVYKWFSSNGTLGEEPGVPVHIKGTVKGHEVYNGLKSTVLTRCKAI